MSVSESEKECPLCMEALDWDDLGFFPCSCGYQICRFCWHRLRTDENGLCPACRQVFPDMPVSFNPEISAEELKKQKRRNRERRSNKEGQVLKPQDLATLRVVQKNLVFVIGLSPRLTQEDLKKEFAHFGKIIKFVHNKSTAYITYSRPEEAIRAIRTLNASAAQDIAVQQLQLQSQLTNGITNNTAPSTNPGQNNALANSVTGLNNASSLLTSVSVMPLNRLKASLGTTKYCNHFLRSQQCPKVGECMYLHEIAEAEASFTKEQMQAGKHVEYEKKLMDSYLAKMDWPANIASQNNGFRVTQQNNIQPQQMQQQISQHQTLARQISPQISANQLSPISNQSPSNYDHRQQSNLNQTSAAASIPIQEATTNNNNIINNNNNNNIGRSSRDLSPDLLPQTSVLTKSLLQQANHHQPSSNHSPNHLIRQSVPTSHAVLDSQPNSESLNQAANLLLMAQQQQQQPHQQSLSRQQQLQQQQLGLDADSDDDDDDDGLDFDPISVSTSGLRDLLDQQVQQAKQQLQMQNYLQQMNSNQSLASVLFQQNNRLNQNATPTSRLLSEATFNGHGTGVPSLATSLSTASNHQEQVAWHNWSSWTNFLQRSGYGFENSK